MQFGLTDQGFFVPTVDELYTALVADLRSEFGDSFAADTTFVARTAAIFVERLADVWLMGEAVYNAQDLDAAQGVALKALGKLSGTLSIEAQPSTVTLTLTGTPTTVVNSGAQVSTRSNNGIGKFLVVSDTTIQALTAWLSSTAYGVGDRVTNASKCYQATVAGTSAASIGPTTGTSTAPGSTEIDGTVTWRYLGDGTGAADSAGQSTVADTVVGVAYDINQRDTPVGGWAGVINLLDAKLGFTDQPDESYRLTIQEEQSQFGSGTAEAIEADLLGLDGVLSAHVFVNKTDVTDADGIPPHTVRALVQGGTDADIGGALLSQVAAGINTDGTTTTFPLDSAGVAQEIKFSRPTVRNIGVAISLVKAANNPARPTRTYPLDGDAQVKLAIAEFGNTLGSGRDVVSSALASRAFSIPGVLNVTACLISAVNAPGTPATPVSSTTISISDLQLSAFDTSWITVTSVDGTP